MAKYAFVSTLKLSDIVGPTLLWIFLIVITLGLALPFFAYYVIQLFINTTQIHEIS